MSRHDIDHEVVINDYAARLRKKRLQEQTKLFIRNGGKVKKLVTTYEKLEKAKKALRTRRLNVARNSIK